MTFCNLYYRDEVIINPVPDRLFRTFERKSGLVRVRKTAMKAV